MQTGSINKIIIVIIYIIIIIMIPLFLDYLFILTVRNRRKIQIKYLAETKAKSLNQSLVVFNDRYHGIVITKPNPLKNKIGEDFTGDIVEISGQMANKSCVMIVSETLEYVDDIQGLVDKLKKITGNNLYVIGLEKNSPRIFWDYKIKHVLEKPYYLPDSNIQWSAPNQLQKKLQKFYYYVFKIVPYDFFTNNKVVTKSNLPLGDKVVTKQKV